jgi:hypothetical protein
MGYRNNLLGVLAAKIAGFCSRRFVAILMNEPGESSGAWPDFRAARSWAREGDIKKAIALTAAELEKEPENYEGLMLLGSLHADSGSVKLALRTTESLLRCAHLTEEQKRVAMEKKAIYERMMTAQGARP